MIFKYLYQKNRIITAIVLVVLLLFSNVDVAIATNYYVSPWGQDINDGISLNKSWATLAHSASFLQPGDTLFVVNGTYYNDRFAAINSGNISQKISIKAYNGTPTFINTNNSGCGGAKYGLISFHNINCGEPGPISYYEVEGLKAVNYTRTFFVGYESHHINLTNLFAEQISAETGFFAGSNTHHIITKDMVINGSWWNGWFIWHDNHHIDAINVTVKNQNRHSFFDLHTNNSYIRIINSSAINGTGIGDSYNHGIYMGHGDYGTDDNVKIINFKYKNTPKNGMLLAPAIGNNLYIENATSTGSLGIIASGYGSNFTMKDVRIDIGENLYSHGINFASGGVLNISDVLLENITVTNTKCCYGTYYAYDIKFESGFDAIRNITIRNPSVDYNDFRINVLSGTPKNDYVLEYTDGRVFSSSYTSTFPRWYPDKSKIIINQIETLTTNTYPMTAHPASGYATITVNKFNTNLPLGNILADFIANTTNNNNIEFTISTLKPGTNYQIKRNGTNFSLVQADFSGRIAFSNKEWLSPYTFTVEEYSMLLLPGNVAGTVTETISGNPLGGAIVTDGVRNTTTDTFGKYFLTNVSIGSNYITASKAGYQETSKRITVAENSTIIVDFEMAPLVPQVPSNNTLVILTATGDTSIKSGQPDSNRSYNTWIDLGRLSGSIYGNYRGLLLFDLSSIPSSALINSATLTLTWEGESRNQTTTIGVYRPSSIWEDRYATWNNRQNSVSWTTPGGDWIDKNGVSYGITPYADVTYPSGSTSDANFNVTSLVQSYITGNYLNTGFFLKANELESTYISFHSSEAYNTSQRPKLTINYTTGITYSLLDVDINGVINEADLDIIRSNFGKSTNEPYPSYDVTRNGVVDVYDITVVSTNISK